MTQRGTERCTCSKCSWDPSTNLELVALRRAWPNRSDEDRECAEVIGVDEDGMLRWHKAPVNEQLMYLIAKWIWDENVEAGE